VYQPFIRHRNAEFLEGFLQFPQLFVMLFLSTCTLLIALFVLEPLTHLQPTSSFSCKLLWMLGILCSVNPPTLRYLTLRLLLHWIVFSACFRLITLFYSGAISTRLVLLDVRDLVSNLKQVIDTGRKPCWLKHEKYLNDFQNAPQGSTLRTLWDQNASDRCWLKKSSTVLGQYVAKLPSYYVLLHAWYM
jgi:hypothetical protein